MRIIIYILLTTLSVRAWGGADPLIAAKNSTNSFSTFVLECENSVTLLDYIELFHIENGYSLEQVSGDSFKALDILIENSKSISKVKAALYTNWIHHFKEQAVFLQDINSGEINDDLGFTEFNGCKVKMLFKAFFPLFKEHSLFIDERLWGKLDDLNKAGAILNYLINLDYIYMEGKTSTSFSRFHNAFIVSNKLNTIKSLKERSLFLEKLGYSYIHFNDLFWVLNPGEGKKEFVVSTSGRLKSGTFDLGKYFIQKLGFNHHIKVENIPNLIFSRPWSGYYELDSKGFVTLNDLQLLSTQLGKFSVSKYTKIKKIKLKVIQNKFYLESLESENIIYSDGVFKALSYKRNNDD